MTHGEKQAYFLSIRDWYRRASRSEKGRILDEFYLICGYQRKYAIRKLNRVPQKHSGKKPGRTTALPARETGSYMARPAMQGKVRL